MQAFFRWLYIEILKENGTDVPEELKKVSQQDVALIAEFLQRFENNNTTSSSEGAISHFYLEKVGQYFKASVSVPGPLVRNWILIGLFFLSPDPDRQKIRIRIQIHEKTAQKQNVQVKNL